MKDKIILNLLEGLKMKVDALEKLSHEPQSYREKCDEMEKRINRLEQKIKTLIRYNKK
jgi:peptidoglycan hydrolase CwlO-like protein